MPVFTESRTVVLPRQPLFDLLLHIESYPQFVPGYISVQVLERGPDWLRVHQEVGLGRMREQFHSTARYVRPEWIEIRAEEGPFRSMLTQWQLQALEPFRTRVDLKLDWQLRSRTAGLLARPVLAQWRRRILDAFLRRAIEQVA